MPSVYLMNDLPTDVQLADVLQVCIVTLLLTAAGNYLPGVARLAHAARGGAAT